MTSRNRRTLTGLLVAIVAAVITWYAAGGGDGTTTGPQPTPTTVSPTGDVPTTDDQTGDVDPDSGLPWIAESELPPEALDTLKDIDNGGPYAYPGRDDTTFTNREGLLPDHESGYYREYTVETPGSDDRGARRIIRGEGGEFYYTDDHYDSFRRIAR
jgi:ribonuclease T1